MSKYFHFQPPIGKKLLKVKAMRVNLKVKVQGDRVKVSMWTFFPMSTSGYTSVFICVVVVGADRGLRLHLNIEQYEYMTGPNTGAGLKILIHDQSQFPLVRDLGQAVPPGAHAFLGIQILQVGYSFMLEIP